MNHWDTRAESLLALARSSETVPRGAKSRVKASIVASIALSGAAGATVSVMAAPAAFAKLPAAVNAASSVLPAAAAAAGTSGPIVYLAPVTVGIALGLSAISPSEVATTAPTAVSASAPAAKSPRASPLAKRRAEPRVTEVQADQDTTTPDPPSTASPGKSVNAPASLAEEASLLEHARLVLRQGDLELTLRLLDRHQKEFPKGVLFFEAMATRAVALCQKGRTDEGMQILSRLEATAQGSGMLPSVRQACRAGKQGSE
jgi:hypothetical protein